MSAHTEDLRTMSERLRLRDPSVRRTVVALALLAAAAFALSLLVQFHVVPLHSDNRDEGVYIFQARMLLDGMVTLPADEYGEFFRPWLSGETDGRIFTEYQIGYPLFLAASELLLGSMRVGLALVAAATVPAVYAFSRAVLGGRRTAMWAAGLVTLSPMTILLSALFTTYSLTVLLLLVASWALLVAAERRSWRFALGAGVATGAALIVRPFDVVLFMAPMAALALYRLGRANRRDLRGATVITGAALGGVVPFGLLTLWYNSRTTGSPLEFPNMAADELNTFGFGTRRLVETEPTISYQVGDALSALWDNVVAVPSWLPGGIVLVALAAVGLVMGGARRGSSLGGRAALLGVVLTFPAGYFFWWATVLSAEGARNGIGPHYYVPAMVALCVLGARGLARLVPARPVPVVAAVVALGAVTAWAIPDKVDDKLRVTRSFENIEQAIPEDLSDAVVVVDYDGRPYTMSKYPFLVNDPELDADVLYAADRGPRNVELFDLFPDRDIYFLRAEMRPGDELFVPSASFEPVTRTTGERVTLSVTPLQLPPGRHARAFVAVAEGALTPDGAVAEGAVPGDRVAEIDLGATDAGMDTVTWEVVPAGAVGSAADGTTLELSNSSDVFVGVETSVHADFRDAEWHAEQHSVVVEGSRLTLLAPPRGHALARFPTATLYLPDEVSTKLRIEADVTG